MNDMKLKTLKADMIKRAKSNNKWRTKEGFVAVKDMEKRHLLNVVSFLKKKEDYNSNPIWRAWGQIMNREILLRKNY